MFTSLQRVNNYLFDLVNGGVFRLFIVVFFVYTLNSSVHSSTDTLPTQLTAVSLLKEHDFDLNEFEHSDFGVPLNELNTVNVSGRLLSLHSVFPAVLALPFYLFFMLTGDSLESVYSVFAPAVLFSVCVSALSVVFLYLALKKITDDRKALYCSLIYAFGTCTWSVSSQELWQHGPSQMFLAASIYLLIRGFKEGRFTVYSGFTLACAVATRPPNLVIFLVLMAYVFINKRPYFARFIFYALPPFLFVFAYSWIYFHSILMFGQGNNPLEKWTTPMLRGLVGLLFSPSKGLFVYSPVLLLSIFGVYLMWKKHNAFFKYLAVSMFAAMLLPSKWYEWHGGLGYGYRLLVDLTPMLCLFLVPVLEEYLNKRWFKVLLILLVAYSVVVQVVGVFFFDSSWEEEANCRFHLLNDHPCLWSINGSQLLYYFKKAVGIILNII